MHLKFGQNSFTLSGKLTRACCLEGQIFASWEGGRAIEHIKNYYGLSCTYV